LSVTDFGSDIGGAVYIILEGANGKTLKETVGREGKISLRRAVKIVWQTAAALSAARAAGVVHNQLTDENILLADTANDAEVVKILDFGSAKSEKEPALDDLNFYAPEHSNDSETLDERADVYALGVILYEMLAGETPFSAENAADLLAKQTENPPTPLSAFRNDLPSDVELVVLKALAKNPEMRFQTTNEFANELNRASNNIAGASVLPNLTDAPDDQTTNNLWKTAFIVLVGISLLSVGLIYAQFLGKQTDVPTQLQTDANGQPVQPINPATGMNEQGLTSMMPYSQTGAMTGNSATGMPQAMPNGDGFGDGYNPWGRGGQPPPGAPPQYVAPGGQVITIPGGGSQFMPNDTGGYILVPQTNTNANVQPSPTATPKTGKTPLPAANTQPSPTPNSQTPPANTAKPTPTPKPEKSPAKPAAIPKPTAPASSGKPPASGEEITN